MEYYNLRMQSTTNSMKEFRAEHEKAILSSASSRSSRLTTSAAEQNAFGGGNNEQQLASIMGVDCILMPFCRSVRSHQKLWPQALVANRSTNCAEVGLIESHGSLWRIVPCSESSVSGRVLLQCSELGESTRFLGADLDIVDMKVDAAVWNLRVAAAAAAEDARVEPGQLRGVVVTLEQVDAADKAAPVPSSAAQPAQLLVCETSRELRSYSELFVEPVLAASAAAAGDGEGAGDGEHPTYRSLEWEVLPEAWLGTAGGDELDFLEGYIN